MCNPIPNGECTSIYFMFFIFSVSVQISCVNYSILLCCASLWKMRKDPSRSLLCERERWQRRSVLRIVGSIKSIFYFYDLNKLNIVYDVDKMHWKNGISRQVEIPFSFFFSTFWSVLVFCETQRKYMAVLVHAQPSLQSILVRPMTAHTTDSYTKRLWKTVNSPCLLHPMQLHATNYCRWWFLRQIFFFFLFFGYVFRSSNDILCICEQQKRQEEDEKTITLHYPKDFFYTFASFSFRRRQGKTLKWFYGCAQTRKQYISLLGDWRLCDVRTPIYAWIEGMGKPFSFHPLHNFAFHFVLGVRLRSAEENS